MKTSIAVGLVVLSACSSESASSGDACNPVGTYKMVTTLSSGDCTGLDSTGDTVTVEQRGSDYALLVGGVQGGCTLRHVSGCKYQSSCPIAVQGATEQGTTQYSLTFSDAGFSGLLSVVFPPSAPKPNGCKGDFSVSAVRQ